MQELLARAKALVDPATTARLKANEARYAQQNGKKGKTAAAPSGTAGNGATATVPTTTTATPPTTTSTTPSTATQPKQKSSSQANEDPTQNLLDYLVGNGP